MGRFLDRLAGSIAAVYFMLAFVYIGGQASSNGSICTVTHTWVYALTKPSPHIWALHILAVLGALSITSALYDLDTIRQFFLDRRFMHLRSWR